VPLAQPLCPGPGPAVAPTGRLSATRPAPHAQRQALQKAWGTGIAPATHPMDAGIIHLHHQAHPPGQRPPITPPLPPPATGRSKASTCSCSSRRTLGLRPNEVRLAAPLMLARGSQQERPACVSSTHTSLLVVRMA
jgi:hypothetical protein